MLPGAVRSCGVEGELGGRLLSLMGSQESDMGERGILTEDGQREGVEKK